MTRDFDSEAERLNTYLDAHGQGQQTDPDGPDPALAETYERVRALNAQSSPDPALMTDIWRTMMSTIPLQISGSSSLEMKPVPALPFGSIPRTNHLSRIAMGFALLALMVGSVLGYRWYDNGSDSQPPAIPAAFQAAATPEDAATESCDLSGDIPIIPDVIEEQLPFQQATVYLLQDRKPVFAERQTVDLSRWDAEIWLRQQ